MPRLTRENFGVIKVCDEQGVPRVHSCASGSRITGEIGVGRTWGDVPINERRDSDTTP